MKIAPLRTTALFLALLAFGAARADVVTLKDGTRIEGKITNSEGDTYVVEVVTHTPPKGVVFLAELAEGSTIKDVKRIPKGDVEAIETPEPDDERYEELKGLLPTKSLVDSSDYRVMIQNGPKRFLTDFPASKHREAVEKLEQELSDEMAKVEGGFLKIRGEWITADDREAHSLNVNARIALYELLKKAQEGNRIGALRDFEALETNFRGSTSYPEAVRASLQILPTYGRQLQGQLRNLAFTLNQEKDALTRLAPEDRAKHEQLMAAEARRFQLAAEAAAKNKIRWRPVNQRDQKSLESTFKIVQGEVQRLRALDLEALQTRADQLYEVEGLIAEEKLDEAGTKLSAALKLRTGSKTRSKDPFVASIQANLAAAREKAQKRADLANRANTASGQLTSALTQGTTSTPATPAAPETVDNPGTEPAGGTDAEGQATPPEEIDPQAALREAMKGRKSPSKDKGTPNVAVNKAEEERKAKEKAKRDKEREEAKKKYLAKQSGGGFSIKYVFFALPVILIGATAVVYLKQQKEGGGGE
ncbi:MAG: PTPDL family protein [Verrucomicrobiota bacterium]